MKRVLYKKDIEEILVGATFIGGGGGGSLSFGLDMLNNVEEQGETVQLAMYDVGDMGAADYAAMVAGLGSPKAMLDKEFLFGPDAVYAFKAFQKAFAAEGKNVKYLYSGEMGGFNTFVPMMVAILSDKDPAKRIPFVDTDGNGRAVPELNTSLGSVRGYPPYPIGLGNGTGDMVIAYGTSDKASEVIARQLCMAYGMKIGFSTWGLSRDELEKNTHTGCVTYAQKIGKAIRAANAANLFSKLQEVMTIRELCTGTIEEIELKAEGGFDFGTTKIKAKDGKRYFIDFKNENLLLRDEGGKVAITAPELICLMDLDTMTPMTNADTKEGMTLGVYASPAHPYWWAEDKKAYECWLPLLEKVGYTGKQLRY